MAILFLLGAAITPGLAAQPQVNLPNSAGTILDNVTTRPFRDLTLSDPDNDAVAVTVSFTLTHGSFLQAPPDFTLSGGIYRLTTRQANNALSLLTNLVFTPVSNRIDVGTTANTIFTVTATDTNGLSDADTITLTVTPVNDRPVLAGLPGLVQMTDKETSDIFNSVTIDEFDNGRAQPVTLTVTIDDTLQGIFAGGTLGSFTTLASNRFSLTGTAAAAQIALRGLRYQPVENRVPVGQRETNSFSIVVADDGAPSLGVTNSNPKAAALSINDSPQLAGAALNPIPVRTSRTAAPFASLVVTDVDQNENPARVGQDQTVQVFLIGAVGSSVLENGSGFSGTNFVANNQTPTEATMAIQALNFRAQTAALPPGTTNRISAVVVVTDSQNVSQTNRVTTIDVFSPFVAPGLSGTRSDQRVNDTDSIAPFSGVSIQSFNAGAFAVLIQLDADAKGELINLSGFIKQPGARATYRFDGPSENATLAIRQLLFRPEPNRLGGSVTELVTFEISLLDGGVINGPDSGSTVIVSPVNDRPTVFGLTPLSRINDNETVRPFSTVVFGDADEYGTQSVRITITLGHPAQGTFTTNSLGLARFIGGGGTWRYTNSAAAANAAIRLLVFDPADNLAPIGLATNVVFTISVNDGHGGSLVNDDTIVRVTSVAGAPQIIVPAQQPISRPVTPPILPFDAVTLTDDEALTVTVAVDPNQGAFTSNSLTASGFTGGGGTFIFEGAAAAATTALRQLDFSPNTNLPPGLVTFTITALDETGNSATETLTMLLRLVQRVYLVTKTNDYDFGESDQSKILGTLRKAVEDAGSNDHITFDLRPPTNGVPAYPATIRLRRTLTLLKNVTLNGPGADQLAISGDTDGNGTGDLQLLQVRALVTIHRLTLTKGRGAFAGGAISVEGGSLHLSYCAVTDSSADQWGGGIDVDEGALSLDHCLIANNSVSAAVGRGGGGVSIYSDQNCLIENTTFSGNQQLSPGGLGGGALYVENLDPSSALTVEISSATFTGNTDAAQGGTSVRPNVFGTRVILRNTILADGQGKNLETDQSGLIISQGGNISDDSTRTVFSVGGAPYAVTNLNQSSDRINTLPLLLPLSPNSGPTLTHALAAQSPALGRALTNGPGTDQRGFWRDSLPDIGAFESNTFRQVVISEIHFNPVGNTNDEFIELYVPRYAEALNLSGFQLWIGGTRRHTFPAQLLQPGQALVVLSSNATLSVPASGGSPFSQRAARNLQLDDLGDTITLQDPAGRVVFEVSYVGSFISSDPADIGFLEANQSITLSPEFTGVFLPHRRVERKVTGSTSATTSSPGRDVIGTPIGGGNAPPIAIDDFFSADEDATTILSVLNNDLEFDRPDGLRVVSVTSPSLFGALLSITNSAEGTKVVYNPANSSALQSLPAGSNLVDRFTYTIIDCCNPTNGLPWPATGTKYTATNYLTILGTNDAPTPTPDSGTTNTALRTLEDVPLNILVQAHLFANDADPDLDDDRNSLLIASIHSGPTSESTLEAVSALGAQVTLEIRFNRNESRILYDPTTSAILNGLAVGQITNDIFYYSVIDRHGAVASAAVTIRVTGVNDGPAPGADFAETDEDTLLSLPHSQLLQNDTDPDLADRLRITGLNGSSLTSTSTFGATISIIGTRIDYAPATSPALNALARKEVVFDSFSYTAVDDHGGTIIGEVTVRVVGVNDRPVTAPENYSVDEDHLAAIGASGVLANDLDPDRNGTPPDDRLRVIPMADQRTAGGAVVNIAGDGSFTFDPRGSYDWLVAEQIVTDNFPYVVVDDSLTLANDDIFSVLADTPGLVLLPVLVNDVTLTGTGGSLRITAAGLPDNGGTVTLNAAQDALLYRPEVNFVGEETFSYNIVDGQGGFDTALVRVIVTSPTLNGHLVANPDTFTVAAGESVILEVLANDNQVPATSESLTIISSSPLNQGGSLTIEGAGPNNTLRYTPAANFAGLETFTYTIAAGGSARASASVSVNVTNRANKLPVNDDVFVVVAGTSTTVLDVLANDRVVPGSASNLVIVAIGTNGVSGTVAINPVRKRLLYTPPPGASTHQEPVLTYVFTDGGGGSATGRVSVTVVPPGLYANPDFCTVAQNSTNTLFVLLNDSVFPNVGQNLTITALGLGTNAASKGSVQINANAKSLIYTVSNNVTGDDTFTYEISDGTLARSQGRIKVTILNRTGAAEVRADVFTVARGSTNNILRVLSNDNLLPSTGERLAIVAKTNPHRGGTLTVDGLAPNQVLLYTPPPGFVGAESFSYSVNDGKGGSATAAVTVQVGYLIANDDSFVVLSGSVEIPLEVLSNDLLLPNATPLRPISSVTPPDHLGTVRIEPGGARLFYTPRANYFGKETFTYLTADDTAGVVTGRVTILNLQRGVDRDTNTVTFSIVGVNDLPTLRGLTNNLQITDKQTTRPFANLTVADVDELGREWLTVTVRLDSAAKGRLREILGVLEAPPGTYAFQGRPAEVTATLRGLVFEPTENRITVPTTETTRFTLTVDDNSADGPVTDATTTVNVTAVNDPPTIVGSLAGQLVYHRLTIRPFAGVTIGEVDDLRVQPLLVSITLDQSTHGNFANLGGFVAAGAGVYTFDSVTAAAATVALRGLIFVPTTGQRLAAGGAETTRFNISVRDGFAPAVTNNTTTVIAQIAFMKRLLATDGSSSDEFGYGVAATRDFIAVGVPLDDPAGSKSGSAYLFGRHTGGPDQWNQVKKLVASDAQRDDQFGYSLGIDEATMVVGARADEHNGRRAGSAYVFQRDQGGIDNWGLVKELVPVGGENDDDFGSAAAVSGDWIIVGAARDVQGGVRSGSASLYFRHQGGTNNWGFVRQIVPTGGANNDEFGFSVAAYGTTMVVGAHYDDDHGARSGSAFVFERNQGGLDNWGLVKKLVPADGSSEDEFARDVAISGDVILIGARLDFDNGSRSGSAYVFERNQGGANNWGQSRKLLPADGSNGNEFGFSVDVDGELLVIGARRDNDTGAKSGSVYIFARNYPGLPPWSLVEKLTPSDADSSNEFGFAVAIRDNTVAVGARIDQVGGRRYGSTYIYRLKFGNAPFLAQPLPDHYANIGVPLNLAVPPGTFVDPDVDDSLLLSSTVQAPAPWLNFVQMNGTFTGTPDAAGQNTVTVTATDKDGFRATDSFELIVASQGAQTPLGRWRLEHFGPTMVANAAMEASFWGDRADPDADGLSNQAEYLGGSNPRQPTGLPERLGLELDRVDADSVVISFKRRRNDPKATYSLQTSPDAVSWSAAETFPAEAILALDDEMEWVSLRAPIISQCRFFRLRAHY